MLLKTLDYRFANYSDTRYALALAIKFGKEYQADTIELPRELAAHMERSFLGKVLLQRKERVYQCMPKEEHSPLAHAWDEMSLSLCDGDMAFS